MMLPKLAGKVYRPKRRQKVKRKTKTMTTKTMTIEEVDEWEKVEEEEEWDPDFDEFDIPKSKTKKSTGGNTSKENDQRPATRMIWGLDEDFKDLDLFNESGFDEEEDDF